MTPKLPVLSGRELIRALERLGFQQVRHRGSHVFMRKEASDGMRETVVPLHSTVAKGTLSAILRQSGVDRDALMEAL